MLFLEALFLQKTVVIVVAVEFRVWRQFCVNRVALVYSLTISRQIQHQHIMAVCAAPVSSSLLYPLARHLQKVLFIHWNLLPFVALAIEPGPTSANDDLQAMIDDR